MCERSLINLFLSFIFLLYSQKHTSTQTHTSDKKIKNTMAVESFLTRALDIRFIDARALATEAKVNLGVQGYPHPDQEDDLIKEAIRVFHTLPENMKGTMKTRKSQFDAIRHPMFKNDDGYSTEFSSGESSCNSEESPSEELSSSTTKQEKQRSQRRRSSFMLPIRRR